MPLLRVRNFLCSRTFAEVRKTQAHLLDWATSNWIFKPTRVLPDGSFLAKKYATPKDRRDGRERSTPADDAPGLGAGPGGER